MNECEQNANGHNRIRKASEMNTFEMQAREAKAAKMAEVIFNAHVTAKEVADRQTEAFWSLACEAAKVRCDPPPSEATRKRVVEMLREREGKWRDS